MRPFSSHATGRAQRASVRNLNGNTPISEPSGFSDAEMASSMPVDWDSFAIPLHSTEPSRSNSGVNAEEGASQSTDGRIRGVKKDNGKGNETEGALVRVKEEPKAISLHSPDLVSGYLYLGVIVFLT